MKVFKVSWYLLIVLFLFSCGEKKVEDKIKEEVSKTEYGKIISAETAMEEFGPVLNKVEINSDELLNLVAESEKTIMFQLKDSLLIADQERKAIFPVNGKVTQNDTFVVYYTLKVEELLKSGGEPITYIERRKEKVTVSNGNSVLEYGTWCPPICGPLTE